MKENPWQGLFKFWPQDEKEEKIEKTWDFVC